MTRGLALIMKSFLSDHITYQNYLWKTTQCFNVVTYCSRYCGCRDMELYKTAYLSKHMEFTLCQQHVVLQWSYTQVSMRNTSSVLSCLMMMISNYFSVLNEMTASIENILHLKQSSSVIHRLLYKCLYGRHRYSVWCCHFPIVEWVLLQRSAWLLLAWMSPILLAPCRATVTGHNRPREIGHTCTD